LRTIRIPVPDSDVPLTSLIKATCLYSGRE
jgi:hypothetical protein